MLKEDNEIKKIFDLEERTAIFGESVIKFVKKLESDIVNNRLVDQVIRSATSIGANYMEANGSESKRDFKHKISICKKESKETEHWLRMIANANNQKMDKLRVLWKEAHELTLIFSKIVISCNKKN